MENIELWISGLMGKDANAAYECLKQLEAESLQSASVYPFFDTFAAMLDSDNAFFRIRGMVLIAANAQWDSDYKIDEIIDKYLKHITDYKPIAARQCIKALPLIARYKPDLRECITDALYSADTAKFKDSMAPLIQKDIQSSLQDIQKL